MAEEWIRVNAKLLHHHPKLNRIANHLLEHTDLVKCINPDEVQPTASNNISMSVALCGLLRTWCAVNEHGRTESDDVLVHCCDLKTIDNMAGVRGFGAAMADVGWAIQESNRVVRFPQFLTYNITPAERRRLKDRERKRKQRCGNDADSLRTNCGQTGATLPNRTEHDRTEINTGPDPPDVRPAESRTPTDRATGSDRVLPQKTGLPDRSRTRGLDGFRQMFYAKVCFSAGWDGAAAQKQKSSVFAVAKRLEKLPNRAALAERIYAAAHDKRTDPAVHNPPAAWQAEVNRILNGEE